MFEGIAKAGNPTLVNQIYTTLYMTEGEGGEVNEQHEVRQIEAACQKTAGSETTIRCEDRSHVTYRGREGGDETKKTQRQKGKADRINVTAGPYL